MADKTKSSPAREQPVLNKSREANSPAVFFFIHVHLFSLYGIWLLFYEVKLLTLLLLIVLSTVAVLGMTAGAHRLWAHRTYQANTGLRIILMLFQTLAAIGSIYDWVLYHRFHHSYFATDDDPYDNNRGFLYAHILARLRQLSPKQEKLLKSIDMSDIEKDCVVMVQKRLYWVMYAVLFMFLPAYASIEYWDESIVNSIFVIGFLRYLIILHASWLIESSICIWGLKPSAKFPPNTNASFMFEMSFWPQYHYLIPYDYKSGEYGKYDCGCSTAFIRIWAALGLASNLQTIEASTMRNVLDSMGRTKQDFDTCLNEALRESALMRK